MIGATLTKDGQPVTAWRGTAAEGVPPASIPQNGYEGGMAESFLATDAGSGAVVLAGETNAGQGGVYVQQILPSPGPRRPADAAREGLERRARAVGSVRRASTSRTPTARPCACSIRRQLEDARRAARSSSATVCAGPQGRLWIAWGDATDGLFVTRSNRAAGALEPVQKLTVPSSAGLTFVQCEGSAGALDLFADDGSGFWHTHVLAQFAVHAAVRRTKAGATVTVSVRDAGDPVRRRLGRGRRPSVEDGRGRNA